MALGQIETDDSENPLRILTRPDSRDAVIVGTREVVTNMVPKDDTDAEARARSRCEVSTVIQGEELRELVKDKAVYVRKNDYLTNALFTFLPFLLIIGMLFFLFRQQMKSAGRGAMSFGKSKARLLTMDRNKVTFKDVAGIQEAKEELFEIVDFLRDPRKFQKLGGSIPKGVLMVGAPGTGKTLLARAIAGEADVPFFSISGSDFVEMFVGVGASRVRDMFEQGKKHAPCLIFIDEIDAVGRHRGHGMGGGHDEREQTLNQLLVEMDGFDTQEGVIIIAATNRPDVLDPALLRPGRFDRQVTINLPDVNGREEILRVHVKKIKLAAGVDLSTHRHAARPASPARNSPTSSTRPPCSPPAAASPPSPSTKWRRPATRSAGAASAAASPCPTRKRSAPPGTRPATPTSTWCCRTPTRSTRSPSSRAAPISVPPCICPEGDKYSTQKKEALANLIVTMGGRIAEVLPQRRRFQRRLRRHPPGHRARPPHGLRMGHERPTRHGRIRRGRLARFSSPATWTKSRNYSEETARVIDSEIKRFIDDAYETAERILTEGRDKVELIAKALLEYETLDASHLRDIIELGEMKDPPTAPKPPPVPDELKKKPSAKPAEEDRPEGNGPIPGAVGAPA